MAIYNESNLTAATNVYDIAKSINDLAGQDYALFLFASVFLVSFFGLNKRVGTAKSLVAASFFTNLAAGLLFFLEWISIDKLAIPASVFAISLVIYFLVRE